jgi:HSP20 family protein
MALIRRTENGSSAAPNRAWDPFQMMSELLRWDPFSAIDGAASTPASLSGSFAPAFEVRETPDAYVFQADLPGVGEDAVELSVAGNRLTISGQRSAEKRGESDRVYMLERSYGAFCRSFALPDGVDTEGIEARLERGVLEVTVPKKPEVKPRRIALGKLLRSSNKA